MVVETKKLSYCSWYADEVYCSGVDNVTWFIVETAYGVHLRLPETKVAIHNRTKVDRDWTDCSSLYAKDR